MILIHALLISFFLYGVVVLIRNIIVYKAHKKAIGLCYDKSRQLIDSGNLDFWFDAWKIYESFDDNFKMVFLSLHKWTFNQLFPGIEKRLEEIEDK